MPGRPMDEPNFAAFLHHDTGLRAPGEAFVPPIVNTSIYALAPDPSGPYQYARWANPTWSALETALGVLEGAETIAFPSGMAAIAAVLCGLMRPGERLLLPSDGYYTTRALADRYLVPAGVEVDLCPTAAMTGRDLAGYRLVLAETPSNPLLDLADLRSLSAAAHAAGALLVVDNTALTALGQRPLELGADGLVCSDTKAVNGHSDVLFGHVSSHHPELLAAVRDWRRIAGGIPGAFEAWLVLRGLETLELRLERMNRSALEIAQALSRHPKVPEVRHPGLPGHPGHALACAQMRQFGSLVGVTLADRAAADAWLAACRYLRQSTSFGGLHSSAERRARWGDAVPEGFVRLSVGCEPTAALLDDLLSALDQVEPPPSPPQGGEGRG